MAAATIGYVASVLGYGMTAARGFRSQVPFVPDAVAVTALACWFSSPRLGLTGSAYAVLIGPVSCVREALFFFSVFGASHWCVAEFPNGLGPPFNNFQERLSAVPTISAAFAPMLVSSATSRILVRPPRAIWAATVGHLGLDRQKTRLTGLIPGISVR